MSIRDLFVKKFGEELARKLEHAASFHRNGVNSAKIGDRFKWVLLICIGYQCFEVDRYREHHGIPEKPTFRTLKKWIRDNADLASYKGDYDYLAAMCGAYDPFIKKPKSSNMEK